MAAGAAYNGDGARLRQIANGVPTTYTLDLAAPLVTALTERTARRPGNTFTAWAIARWRVMMV